MRNFIAVLSFVFLSAWAGVASAELTFSNVSYTANSVTFTIDGDMSGYTPSSYLYQFSLVYGGDIWVGDPGFEPNAWSSPVFDNKSFADGGNTGTSGNNYSWSSYGVPLDDAVVSNATITLTLTEPDLNESAQNPVITFVWGNGSSPSAHTVVGTWVGAPATPVPTLSQWALIVLTVIFGIVAFSQRRRIF